ncbi:MAG: hypothetical protein JST26_02975 [Bacteroidetes bacterium]|nr:hypothetical protein [Bacteroidota bacterium]
MIAFGADLGIYNYRSTVASSNTSDNNAAANKMLNLQYERGVLNWLGIGAKLQLCDYFTSKDTATGAKATVRSFDALVVINAHMLRSKRVDLLGGVNVGYSYLNYSANDKYISQATGGGSTFDIHFQPRFYFGDHFGMFINLAYVHYGYNNLDFQNTQTHIADVLDLNGGGVNFGFGFQAKF